MCLKSRLLVIMLKQAIMQFYPNSTSNKKDQQAEGQQNQFEPDNLEQMKAREGNIFDNFLIYQKYCGEMIEIINKLNIELIKNNQLIDLKTSIDRMRLESQNQVSLYAQEKNSRESEDNSTVSRKNDSQINMEVFNVQKMSDVMTLGEKYNKQEVEIENINHENYKPIQIINISPKRQVIKKKIKRKEKTNVSEDEYQPDPSQIRPDDNVFSRISESKNIPKSFSKAILTFIKSQDQLTKTVVQRHCLDYDDFSKSLNKLGGHLCSIAQLQWLWAGPNNPYSKIYRILSFEYLRKRSLSYIFNSRVNIFFKHIKYRLKMLEAVSNPESFTRMKQF